MDGQGTLVHTRLFGQRLALCASGFYGQGTKIYRKSACTDSRPQEWVLIGMETSPYLWHLSTTMAVLFKGVMSRSRVAALSEVCFPFVKGGNSTFIVSIASDFSPKTEYRSLIWLLKLTATVLLAWSRRSVFFIATDQNNTNRPYISAAKCTVCQVSIIV